MSRHDGRCDGRVTRSGRRVACGESARWRRPDGSEFTALVYSPSEGLEVGWCCARKTRGLKEQFKVNFLFDPDKDFPPGYEKVPYVPDEGLQDRFRHALRDTGTPRVGGLRRLDGSEVIR